MARPLVTLVLLALSLSPALAATRRKKPAEPAAPTPAPKTVHIPSTVGRRNVLLIIVDDLNADVGWLGGPSITPNMDKLAHQGMRFTNAQAAHVQGNASRVALFTGLLPSTSGVFDNGQDWRRSVQLQSKLTLPEFFMSVGYKTQGGGSVFESGHSGLPSTELDTVWEERKPGIITASAEHVNGLDLWDWGALDAADEETGDGRTAAWAADRLQQETTKKLFFMTVGIEKPHPPWYAPRSYFDHLPAEAAKLPEVREDDLEDVPNFASKDLTAPGSEHARMLAAKAWPDAVRSYRAAVAFADAQVGLVLKALEKSPVAKTTIVCLTSSRGFSLGQKQCWREGRLWESGTHVPLTLFAPGVTKPDSVSDEPVSLIDLYPTLVDLTRQEMPKNLDGTSLVPLLLDPSAQRSKPVLTTMGGAEQASYAARSAAWRYIRYADGSEELYDHGADPQEWTNVAASPQNSEVKQTLAQAFPKEWHHAERTAEQMAGRQGADGSLSYDLQGGDQLPPNLSPPLAGHGMDVEVSFDYAAGANADCTLITQGDAQNGWVLRLAAGQPTATLFIAGQPTTLTTEAPAPGVVRLRLFVPGNGTMNLGVAGQSEIAMQCPFATGFPQQPSEGLSVGAAAPGIAGAQAFTGTFRHVWVTVLPP